MDKPGISRAVPMGVIGFMVGALVVIIIRALQSLTPIWDPGVGLVFGTFFSAGFFIWGIGGFDPRMSAHGDEHDHEDEAAHAAEEAVSPTGLLAGSMWQVLFATLIGIALIGAFAWLGPKLITTADADASVGAIGMVPMELFGQEMLVSQLVIFAVFILITIVSLAVAAGAIGFILNYLNQGLVESRATAGGGAAAALPAPVQTRAPRPQWLGVVIFLVQFVVLFTILYLLFYYVLIGLIFPDQVLISAVNALLFTILILRPRWVVQLIATVAGWLAGVLRSRNNPYAGVRKNERRNRP